MHDVRVCLSTKQEFHKQTTAFSTLRLTEEPGPSKSQSGNEEDQFVSLVEENGATAGVTTPAQHTLARKPNLQVSQFAVN